MSSYASTSTLKFAGGCHSKVTVFNVTDVTLRERGTSGGFISVIKGLENSILELARGEL